MNARQSPLFEPVLWDGDGFRVLDELSVPQKIDYIRVTDVSEALTAVREMKTRAYGQVLTFLYSVALVAQQYREKDPEPLRQRIAQLTQQFCDVRPTFDFSGLGRSIAEWFDQAPSDGAVGENIGRQARESGAQITRARSARAKRAAALLPNPARVLTHCNVSGELVAVANYCKQLGKKFSVIATETRPYLQGARLTAWELAQADVPVALIPDCAVAQVMARGEVNAVLVGADRSAQNGDIINKVGTYPIALMANEYGVPFHALVQNPRSLARGGDVPIEERPAVELLFFHGRPLVASNQGGIKARYPAFDVTPAALITHLVGFDDLYTPETFRQKYQTVVNISCDYSERSRKYFLIYGIPATSQYSYLMSALKAAQSESLLVPEMRPQLWGAQTVLPGLLERKAAVTLISDNMMGTFFAQGEISKLCLFYSGLTEEGLTGCAGSLIAVRLARLHGVPIELLAGERPPGTPMDHDVSTFLGTKICPTGVTIGAVEDELVPWPLLNQRQD